MLAAVSSALAQAAAPTIVASRGYINGTPLTAHTTASMDSRNSTTMVAFLSTHPTWNGAPVSISGVTDNQGNTWQVLAGPSNYVGGSFTLMSAIYYVQLPTTSATHTVTATLTNGAPFVMHVFAVAGADPTVTPVHSAIVGPSAGPTADVVTPAITVAQNSLLLAWVKNENNSNAGAMDSYTLDSGSTSYLWAEYGTAVTAGSYTGHFDYANAIGWHTAVVGLRPWARAVAFDQSVSTFTNTPVNITLTGSSPNNLPLTYTIVGQPAHGTVTGSGANRSYSPTTGYVGLDSFTFKVNDGQGDSNVATVTVNVRVPNRAPTASDGTGTATSGAPSAVGMVATDPDGDPLTYTIVSAPLHGTLSGSGATRTYTSANGYVGSDQFTFKANDGQLDSNIATMTINVGGQAPAATIIGSRGYINGTPLTAHAAAAFDTRNASTLVAFVSTHPVWAGAQVSINGVTDNLGNTWQLLTGPTTWAGGSFTLVSSIYYVNLPATSQTHTVTANLSNGSPLVMHVLAAGGTDPTTPPVYSAIVNPTNGPTTNVVTPTISLPQGSVIAAWAKNENSANATALDGYSLDAGSTSFLWAETGTAATTGGYSGHFAYSGAIGWQSAVVGLRPWGRAVAYDQSLTTFANTALGITLTGLSPNNQPLTFSIVSTPAHGTLTGSGANRTYTPAANYVGSDSFTFKTNDGLGDSNIATVTITVRAANHAPVAGNSSATVTSGSLGTVGMTASDADGDPLTYIIVTQPAHGTLSGSGASRSYSPANGYVGGDSFTFKANDGVADSNVATVTISVVAAPTAPTVVRTRGYINGALLTAHTAAAIDTRGATSMLAFVSTHPTWNGAPVAITGVSDNLGNTWKLLTGPSTWTGSGLTLLSSIYYVQLPVTGAAHTVTANLSNGAPLVMHVLAAAGTDPLVTPSFSAIVGPAGAGSTNVLTPATPVSQGTLLVAWTKNENNANAAALDGYTLDAESTAYLWAEYGVAGAAGSYAGHFVYSNSIGWQAAIVGLKPAGPPAISGFTPGTGSVGAPVTIVGTGLLNTTQLWFNGTLQPSFTVKPSTVSASFTTNAGPINATVGDFDGDGKVDVAVANHGYYNAIGNTISVFRSQSTPGIVTLAPKVDFVTTNGPHDIVTADIDGDGKLDLVTPNYGAFASGNTVSVLRNQSTIGNISFAAPRDFGVNNGPPNVAVGDLDGDGKPDIVATSFNDGSGFLVSLLRNTSTPGNISFEASINYVTARGPYGVALGDVDGDGKLDVVVAIFGSFSGDGSSVMIFRNTSTPGALSLAPGINFTVGAGPREVAIGDLDGDGKADIVSANYGGNGTNNTVSVLRNLSTSGNLAFAPKSDYQVGSGPMLVRLIDSTGTGRLDVAVGNYGAGVGQTVSLLRNTSSVGTIGFAPKVDIPTAAGPHGLAVGDIDGDGFADIIPANYGNLQGSGNTITVVRLAGDSQIQTTVPAGATSGPIQVKSSGGTTTSTKIFVVPQ